MSDCGVCLTGFDGETIGYRCKIVEAGQDWECCECDKVIPKGSKYELASGFRADDGNSHWQTKTCLVCAEIGEAFYCGGRWHGAGMWEKLADVGDKLNISCFERLKTPEAKAELQRRWQEWKGLRPTPPAGDDRG